MSRLQIEEPTLNRDANPTPPPAAKLPKTTTLLRFEDVSKWYGSVLALNQVWFPLSAGITGLVGANGAGKSTLIKLATGQVRPTIGTVKVCGIEAWNWEARRLVGYCPDHDAFYEDMTGREFVFTMAKLCGYTRQESHRRSEAVLDRVGMSDRADRKLRGYSKGMRQRIKLAQALLHDPKLLILDEPLSGVDPVGRQELLELFRSLAAQGKALLISSHELEELEKLTNEVIIMARGRIADRGTVQEIRDRMENFPLSVRIEVDNPRKLAQLLLQDTMPDVLGCDLGTGDHDGSVLVRIKRPRHFFQSFGRVIVEGMLDIRRLEPLDDSTHAILGYLLGGSGKT